MERVEKRSKKKFVIKPFALLLYVICNISIAIVGFLLDPKYNPDKNQKEFNPFSIVKTTNLPNTLAFIRWEAFKKYPNSFMIGCESTDLDFDRRVWENLSCYFFDEGNSQLLLLSYKSGQNSVIIANPIKITAEYNKEKFNFENFFKLETEDLIFKQVSELISGNSSSFRVFWGEEVMPKHDPSTHFGIQILDGDEVKNYYFSI